MSIYRSIHAMLPALVLAIGLANSACAESVTDWVMIFDNGDGIPFVGGSEATSSPVLGRADKNSIAAYFSPVTLTNDGDFIALTGSMSVDVNLANNQFRWGLFEGPATLANPVADPTGYTGFSAMSAVALSNGTMGSVASGTAPHPFAGDVTTEIQADPTGTAGAVAADTALGFMMRVTKNGANVDVTASLIDPLSSYDIQYSVSDTPASPGSFTYDTAAFLFGGGMNGGGATFSNIEVATGNALPEVLTLDVNTVTGMTHIFNGSGGSIDFRYYEINSVTESLDKTNWLSLDDQDFDEGVDLEHSWAEAGGSDSAILSENNLLSFSTLADQDSLNLGSAFHQVAGTPDLSFTYALPDGTLLAGLVTYDDTPGALGDYNGSGMVEQGDLDLVLLNWGSSELPDGWVNDPPTGPIGSDDLAVVKANWGASVTAAAAQTVPEPASALLLLVGVVALAGVRRQ